MIKIIEIDMWKSIIISIDTRTGEVEEDIVIISYKNFPKVETYLVPLNGVKK